MFVRDRGAVVAAVGGGVRLFRGIVAAGGDPGGAPVSQVGTGHFGIDGAGAATGHTLGSNPVVARVVGVDGVAGPAPGGAAGPGVGALPAGRLR